MDARASMRWPSTAGARSAPGRLLPDGHIGRMAVLKAGADAASAA